MIGEVLAVVFNPLHLLIICFGAFVGMVLGAIPGLSGGLAITICLPMTFSMDKFTAICLLCGIWIGSASGSFIGSILLGIPGTASSLANLMAYSIAKNGSKYPEKFGTGCIDGVIAPEVANNAAVGGAVIPFVALGIPGDGTTALLLGALTIQGIEAGPLIFQSQPVLVYTIFAVLMIGAVFLVIVQAVGMPLMPMLLRVPYHYLYPAILVLVFIGAYTNSNNMFIMFMNLLFTAVGVFLDFAGMPMSPFMLSFVLGGIVESNLRKAVTYGRGSWMPFLTRPISLILIVVGIGACLQPYVKDWLAAAKARKAADQG